MSDDYDPYLDSSDKNNWGKIIGQPIVSAPRQSGKQTMLPRKHPRDLETVLRQVEDRGVLVFMSGRQRFSYAAIGVRATGKWYITGAGQFYGKNEFTRDEFIDVLLHDEVAEIWQSTRFDQVI